MLNRKYLTFINIFFQAVSVHKHGYCEHLLSAHLLLLLVFKQTSESEDVWGLLGVLTDASDPGILMEIPPSRALQPLCLLLGLLMSYT